MDSIGESHSITEANTILSSELTTHLIHLNRLVKSMMSMQECQLIDTNKYRLDFDSIASKYHYEKHQLDLRAKIKKIKAMKYTEEYKPEDRITTDSPSPFGYSCNNRSGESSTVPGNKPKPSYQLRPISARSESNKEASGIANERDSSQKPFASKKKSTSSAAATDSARKPSASARLKFFAVKEDTLNSIIESKQKQLVSDIFALMQRNSQLPSSLPEDLTLVDKLEFIHKFVQRYQ